MELKRKDTKMLQGLAALFMVWLHMFCNDNIDGLYRPCLYLFGYPISLYIAQLSDCCVMIFAFCSGYGHSVSNRTIKNRLRHLFVLFVNYWVVLMLFIPIGFAIGIDPAGRTIIDYVLMIPSFIVHNGAHWYLSVYAIIIILSDKIIDAVRKKPLSSLCITFICYLIGIYIRFYILHGVDYFSIFYVRIGCLLTTIFEYVIGVYFGLFKLFPKIYKQFERVNKTTLWTILICITLFITIIHGHMIGNIAVSAFSGLYIIIVFSYLKKSVAVEKIFIYLGEHSTNIWLVHMYFTSYYFAELVFKSKYVITTYVTALALSLFSSYIIKLIQKYVIKSIKISTKLSI